MSGVIPPSAYSFLACKTGQSSVCPLQQYKISSCLSWCSKRQRVMVGTTGFVFERSIWKFRLWGLSSISADAASKSRNNTLQYNKGDKMPATSFSTTLISSHMVRPADESCYIQAKQENTELFYLCSVFQVILIQTRINSKWKSKPDE